MSGRLRVCLVVMLWGSLSAGCATGAPEGSGPPGPTPTVSVAATTPTPTPTPLRLTAEKAADALAGVAVPAGFRADIRCPARTAKDEQICDQPTDDATAWSASLTYVGEELPKANGLRATLVMNVVTAKTERSATALYGRQAAGLRRRAGSYTIPVSRQARSYTPGQRGRGTLTSRRGGDWPGVELSESYVLVFDGSTSRTVSSGTHLLRRGIHVLSLSWSTGDAQVRSKLAPLPDRVAAALDESGRP